ncbi:MAG: cell division septation protein DedD [Candidatus Krumholzibacteriia bacterium]|jgi:cell division septation protein DedD
MAQTKRRGVNVLGRVAVALLLTSLFVCSGCGGDDGSNAEFSKGSLMPGSQDDGQTGAVDSMAIADTTLNVMSNGMSQEMSRSTEMPSLEPASANNAIEKTPGVAVTASQKTTQMAAKKETSSAAEGEFSVQIGSFRSADNAKALVERVNDLGYSPEVEVASLGGQTYHRVIVKGLVSRQAAERCGEKIRSSEGITYLIRHHK